MPFFRWPAGLERVDYLRHAAASRGMLANHPAQTHRPPSDGNTVTRCRPRRTLSRIIHSGSRAAVIWAGRVQPTLLSPRTTSEPVFLVLRRAPLRTQRARTTLRPPPGAHLGPARFPPSLLAQCRKARRRVAKNSRRALR